MATAPLLHLRFEYVADSPLKFVPNAPFVFAERRPVVVVEILDDLKGPPAVNHIAADDLGLEPLGDRIVAGGAQSVARLAQQQIGMSHQLMKRVQLTPCPLDTLQGLRNGADGLDRRIIHRVGAHAFIRFRLGHRRGIPTVRRRCIISALKDRWGRGEIYPEAQ